MAKVVNTFVKGKLNKDLDARLVPNGEYRDAKNVQISKSEGPDVGELENVLGNKITSLTWSSPTKCIGWVVDEAKSFAYLFLTDNEGEDYNTSAEHRIVQYNVSTDTFLDLILPASSAFLNFSQLNPIYGVNILDDLLFWTDNRNQPRKINITRAVADGRYYLTEDQISVAKYSPYEPIQLWQQSTHPDALPNSYETSMKNVTDLFLPGGGSCQTDGVFDGASPNNKIKNLKGRYSSGTQIYYVKSDGTIGDANATVVTLSTVGSVTVNPAGAAPPANTFIATFPVIFPPQVGMEINSINGVPVTPASAIPSGTTVVSFGTPPLTVTLSQPLQAALNSGDVIIFSGPRNPNEIDTLPQPAVAPLPLPDNTTLIFGTPNPYYNPNFSGDPAFLDDKFVRFSYRFRYDDNEYSIFAPFTQSAFIPKQDGYFLYESGGFPSIVRDDQADTYRSTVVEFMENKVEDINLIIPLPFQKFTLSSNLKLKEIDILYKESDGLAVRVIDTIPIAEIANSTGRAQVDAPAPAASTTIPYDNLVGTINVGDIVTGASITDSPIVESFTDTEITVSTPQTIPLNQTIYIGDPYTYVYNYVSKKPIKTLPEDELTRVFDKIPVKALAQEVSGNRVIYGNYLNKHTPPEFIDYNVTVGNKSEFSIADGTALVSGNQTVSGAGPYVLNLVGGSWTGASDIEVGDDILDSTGIFLAKVETVPIPNTQITLDRVPEGGSFAGSFTFLNQQILTFTDPGTVNQRTSKIEYPNSSLKQNRNYQVGIVLSDRFGRQSSVILSSNKDIIESEGSTFIGDTIYSSYITNGDDKQAFPGESLKVLFNNPIGPTVNSNFAWPGIYNGDDTSDDYNPLGWYSYKIVVKQTEQDYYNVYLPGIMSSYPEDQELEIDSSSHIVLINDNINKVPRDLNEVGPAQKQFRSSVRLFGRVENTDTLIDYDLISGTVRTKSPNIGRANQQYYPGRIADTVSTISDMRDLFEYDPLNPPRPNYFPQFYQFDSNPLIGRVSTINKIGQNSTTNYSPASAVVDGAFISPNSLVDVNNVAGTITPGQLVQGPNIPENVYVGSTTPPFPATPVTQVGLIKQDGVTAYEATLDEGDTLTFVPAENIPGAFPLTIPGIQYLSIYETEPVISNLDIYWETSTTGLIEDLNNFILNETSGGSGLFPLAAGNFKEDLGAAPQNVFDNVFRVVDQFGIALDPADFTTIDVSLESVVDGGGNNVDTFFAFPASDQATGWNVKTTATYYNTVFYGDNPAARNFTFNFLVTTESITAGVQPSTVLTPVTLNLGNVIPTLTPSANIITNRGVTTSIQTLTATNGANNPALRTQDLTLEIYDILQNGVSLSDIGENLDDFFVLGPPTIVANELTRDLFFASPPPPVATYNIKVRASDAGGDNEEEYGVVLDQLTAVQDQKITGIVRFDDEGDDQGPCPSIGAIQIRVNASAIPGQNGYYLFIGYQGGNFNQLTNNTNTITIDRTNAFTGSAGINCNGPTAGGGGSTNIFYFTDTPGEDFSDLRAQAVADNCTAYTEDCSGNNPQWDTDPSVPGSLATEIDISDFFVEII